MRSIGRFQVSFYEELAFTGRFPQAPAPAQLVFSRGLGPDNSLSRFTFVWGVLLAAQKYHSHSPRSLPAAKRALQTLLCALLLPLPSQFAPCQEQKAPATGSFLADCTACAASPSSRAPMLELGAWPQPGFVPAPAPLAQSNVRSSAQDLLPSAPEPAAQENAAPAQTDQKHKRKYSKTSTAGSPGHIFWIVPAYKVDYAGKFQPLTAREKFQEWAQSAYDPLGLTATAAEAGTLEHSATDGFCGYGPGAGNYLKCFGSMELDANDSSFFGDFVFTVWWHQDPRYFRLGEGSFGKRAFYAISRVFITFNDQGKNVFYSSGLAGTTMAGIVSNAYYPQQDRGVSHTVSRIALDLGNTALYNGAAEFWPDIHKWVQRRF